MFLTVVSFVLLSKAEIPGLKRSQHIVLAVPNAQQTVDFFVDVIGCKSIIQLRQFGPYKCS